jgi:hypothetical protein
VGKVVAQKVSHLISQILLLRNFFPSHHVDVVLVGHAMGKINNLVLLVMEHSFVVVRIMLVESVACDENNEEIYRVGFRNGNVRKVLHRSCAPTDNSIAGTRDVFCVYCLSQGGILCLLLVRRVFNFILEFCVFIYQYKSISSLRLIYISQHAALRARAYPINHYSSTPSHHSHSFHPTTPNCFFFENPVMTSAEVELLLDLEAQVEGEEEGEDQIEYLDQKSASFFFC